jgi:flagellin FlaB
MKRDNAFTGLEAAIVLIAFVVVAAIFSYVMLGAGFFATQKAQEVTYAGIQQTTSNLVPGGTVYGNLTTTGKIGKIQLSVAIPVGGQSVEFSQLLIVYSAEGITPYNLVFTQNGTAEGFKVDTCTDRSGVIASTATSVLVSPGNSCNLVLTVNDGPSPGSWFQVEIQPPIGAPTAIRKTIPTGYKGGKLL